MRAPHLLGHVAAQLVGFVNGGAVAFVPRQRQLLQRRYDVPPLPRQPAARLQVKTRERRDLSALSALSWRRLSSANEAAMAEPVQAAPGRPTRSGRHSGSAGWGVPATHVVQRKRGAQGGMRHRVSQRAHSSSLTVTWARASTMAAACAGVMRIECSAGRQSTPSSRLPWRQEAKASYQ